MVTTKQTLPLILAYSMDRNQIHHFHREILSQRLFWSCAIPITVSRPPNPFLDSIPVRL